MASGYEIDHQLADVETDDELDVEGRPPLLNIAGGIRPPSETPRCPPKAWLEAAGFDVPFGTSFDAVPVAPVAGERPTRYLDLFGRQMLARLQTSDLTMAALSRHDKACGAVRHTDPVLPHNSVEANLCPGRALAQNAAWLEAFIARSRATPLREVACSVVGSDVGFAVAGFLDSLSDDSGAGASLDPQDAPDGLHVTGQKIVVRPVHRGRGRSGFYVDSDAGVSTPGRSQSPPPQRTPPPIPMDPPTPPLIRMLTECSGGGRGAEVLAEGDVQAQ